MANEIINKKSQNFKFSVKKPAVIANERESKVVNILLAIEGLTFESVELI